MSIIVWRNLISKLRLSNPFNLKIILLLIAVIITFGTFYYTQDLVYKLQHKEEQIVELYAKSLRYLVNADPTTVTESDFTFILENVIKPIDFPLILTDNANNVQSYRNFSIDSVQSEEKQKKFFDDKINELRMINDPIPVIYQDSLVLQIIYYGDSDLVNRLKYYPYLQIIVAVFFVIVAYISFSYIKRNEQSNIWVGMAKETAHQLGTPLSSLFGWMEILKMYHTSPDKVLDATNEINNDLNRLNKIANRFSKIGSIPNMVETNLYNAITDVILYFQRRLPHMRKNISITISGNENTSANINIELFEWVIENLIKNALDAIENTNGLIHFQISTTDKSVLIEVSDNGKGIDLKRRKDIFRPGYSTKRRGWGLGLTLSKRIVEDYHGGKIVLQNSEVNKGSTFLISLRKS